MKRSSTFQAVVLLAFSLTPTIFTVPSLAAEPVEMTLWQTDAPLSAGQEEGDQPRLHLYRVDSEQPTPAIVILPGGGYGNLASDHEGSQIAKFFNDQGVTAAVCFYRHRGKGNAGKGYGHPVPMLDAQRAVRFVRTNAKEWNIDPGKVGIIGFSAGGHLASTVSTHFDAGDAAAKDPIDRVSSRPDFAILGYPVISLGEPHTHKGSQRNLLGENPDPELLRSLSNEKAVTAETPPTFLFHTAEDKGVPAENSLVYISALVRAGVPAELHLFETGRHGIGLGADQPGAKKWPDLCVTWLRNRGVISP
ncbi:MAG TPA: alpha/beta hydrolase [Planctomycetaceae bacterium]|nr:alpha/beta hydrolase [Planctomycetaceae bacterium]